MEAYLRVRVIGECPLTPGGPNLLRVAARRRNDDEAELVTFWVPAEDVDPIPPPGEENR